MPELNLVGMRPLKTVILDINNPLVAVLQATVIT